MKFEGLSAATKKMLHKNATLLVVLAVLSVALVAGNKVLSTTTQTYRDRNAEYQTALSSLKTLQSSVTNLESVITGNTDRLSSSFMTKQQFIDFVGETCSKVGCDLIQLSGGDTVSANNINRINFTFEIAGTPSQLYRMIQSINGLNTKYMLKSISMRKTEDFLWLDRETHKNEELSWWDLSNLKQPKDPRAEEEALSVAMLFGSPEMTLYLDIDFVTTEVELK